MNHNTRMDDFRRTGKANDQFLTSIIYGNGRSLGSHPGKIEVLREAARQEDADILLISEAGFVEGGVQGIDGFSIAGNQPKQVKSGAFAAGVTAWIREGSPIKILCKNCIEYINGFQALELHINLGIIIVVFYRSPNQDEENIKEVIEYIEQLNDKVYLFGDLNIPNVCWTNGNIEGNPTSKITKQELIYALISAGDRKQIVDFPTRINNILTLFWAGSGITLLDSSHSEAVCRHPKAQK